MLFGQGDRYKGASIHYKRGYQFGINRRDAVYLSNISGRKAEEYLIEKAGDMEELSVGQTQKNQEASGKALLRKSAVIPSETIVLKTDQDYFSSYINIGKLYQEKRLILDQKQGSNTESHSPRRRYFKTSLRKTLKAPTRKKQEKPEVLEKKTSLLNEKIKKTEQLFWGAVENAQKEGIKFVFEDIASRFGLQLFEKRILIFFYYLEFHEINRNVCLKDDLLFLFDLENSVFARLLHYKYFNYKTALFENNFLAFTGRKGFESERVEIALTSHALMSLSEELNGQKPDPNKRDLSSDFDSVGYVKEPEYVIDDVLLKDEIKDKVKLFLDAFRDNKLEAMGVKERIKKGLGTVFLFYGPPGTGKSMLAEAMAKYVNKKILMVEYPKIMERWVGATDKNIANIFQVAKKEDLVVVLDEADTLFYNRAFAFQEHDIRFVNEMLQELERFEGMIILTTNMTELLDQALERRVSLKIKFEPPTKEARCKIWQSHLPKQLKVSEDVDFNLLANKYEFSGGNIKNAVLNAMRKIVSRKGDTLLMQDLTYGADMEKDGMYSSLHKEPMGFLAN